MIGCLRAGVKRRILILRYAEESLLMVVFATECLHGRALVRLDASFCLDPGNVSAWWTRRPKVSSSGAV